VAAALELRARGHAVTLFERGEIPNAEASSTDVSKIIRRTSYPEPTYIELATRAANQWRIWHERLSQSIYYQTGILIVFGDGIDSRDTEILRSCEKLSRQDQDISQLTLAEARLRFPQFAIEDGDTVFHDSWAGYLRSGQAVADLAALARDDGVVIREHATIEAVEDTTATVRVAWDDDAATFDRVVVAAGPWIADLVPQLAARVRLTRQQMAFFEPQDRQPFERDRFPAWMFSEADALWYGFPFLHEGYVKIAEDSRIDETTVDVAREPTPAFLDWAREFAANRIPGLGSAKVVGGRSCLYTNMPDIHFVIDWAPGSDRVLIAGCGSGHGFKFGGAIGPVIADALEDRHNPAGDLFRIGERLE